MRRLALQIAIQAIKREIDSVYWAEKVKEHLREIQADLEASHKEALTADGLVLYSDDPEVQRVIDQCREDARRKTQLQDGKWQKDLPIDDIPF